MWRVAADGRRQGGENVEIAMGGVSISLGAVAGSARGRRGQLEFGGNNVQSDGGTATGSFVYDTSTNRYTNWSKTLSGGDFTAFAYDPTNGMAQTCCSDLISLTHTSLTRVLEIEYDNAGDAADSPQITLRV